MANRPWCTKCIRRNLDALRRMGYLSAGQAQVAALVFELRPVPFGRTLRLGEDYEIVTPFPTPAPLDQPA